MSISPTVILKTMHFIFWVIFIGLCIKTGSILFSFIVSIAVNPIAAADLYRGLDLSGLYGFGLMHYSILVALLVILTALKAAIGYWAVKIFLEMRIEKPFSPVVHRIIRIISQISVAAGLLALIGSAYSGWLRKAGVTTPLYWPYGEILFFAGIIYLISLVFQKGIDLQSENDLTV